MNFVGRRTVDSCQRFISSQKKMHLFVTTARRAFAFPLRRETQVALTWALFRRSNGASNGSAFCGADCLVRKETSRRSEVDNLSVSSLGTARLFVATLRFQLGGKICQFGRAMMFARPSVLFRLQGSIAYGMTGR
jgi:hypothetical protein